VRTFTYTATLRSASSGAGRMTQATVFTLTTRFTYNGDGARRVVEVVGQGTTTYTVDYAASNRILAEETITGAITYLYGHDCLGQYDDAEDEWLYYLNDATGYVRQGADEQGQVVSSWLFDPDGTVLEGPEGLVSHLICGGVYDWSTGLIFKGGRYFDPSLGIWLALIPLVLIQSWRGRKKRRRGWPWYVLVLVVVGVGGMLVGCGDIDGDTPPPTATCTTAPPPPPEPPQEPSNWFSDRYGDAIAQRARELVQLSDSGEINVTREMVSCWDIEQLGQVTEYVCADVVADAYYVAGINLQELLLASPISSNWQYPCAAIHNAQAFGQYLQATGQLRDGDDFPYYQGEIVIGYSDWAHAGVIVEGGYDEDSVWLVQASYGRMVIEETTLSGWKSRGPGSYVWHGHPSAEELGVTP
jgi:hypothetical protein